MEATLAENESHEKKKTHSNKIHRGLRASRMQLKQKDRAKWNKQTSRKKGKRQKQSMMRDQIHCQLRQRTAFGAPQIIRNDSESVKMFSFSL